MQVKDTLSKKHWNMSKPNMLMKLDFGTRHPTSLSTPKLAAQSAFEEIRRGAQASDRDLDSEIDTVIKFKLEQAENRFGEKESHAFEKSHLGFDRHLCLRNNLLL